MPILTPIANEIVPIVIGVDSSRDYSRMDRVLVDFDSGWVVPSKICFVDLLRSRCLLQKWQQQQRELRNPD